MGVKQYRNNSSDDENSEIVYPKIVFSHIAAPEREIDLMCDVIVFAIDAAANAYGFSGKDLTDKPSQHNTDAQEHDAWRRARITAFFALKEAVQIRFTTIADILYQGRVSGGDLAHFLHDCDLPLYRSDSEFRATTDSVISQASEYAGAAGLDGTLADSWSADDWRKVVDVARIWLNSSRPVERCSGRSPDMNATHLEGLSSVDKQGDVGCETGALRVSRSAGNHPFIYLLDRSASMVAAWQEAFGGAANVIATRGDFARFMDEHPEVDCVVSPANSFGIMDGGYDRAITDYFGCGLMEAVQRKIVVEWLGEQPVGTSISVEHNGMTLIHTPVMRVPSTVVDPMLVYHCMRTALIEAMHCGVETMVIPAWGAGCGMLPFDTVADLMAAAYFQVKNPPSKLDWDYANSRQLPDMGR